MFYNISAQIQPGEAQARKQRETRGQTTRTAQDPAQLAAVEDRRTSQARDKVQRGKKLDRQRDCKGKKGEGIKLYKKDKKKKGKKMKQNATKTRAKYLCVSHIYYKYNVFFAVLYCRFRPPYPQK